MLTYNNQVTFLHFLTLKLMAKLFTQKSTSKITRSVGLLCIFYFFTAVSFLKAQSIPDKNFASAIKSVCNSCITINADLTGTLIQPAAGNLTYLDVTYRSISDLTGINGFTSLQTLYCYHNLLTSLATLPTSLTYLNCESNKFTSLSALPTGLLQLFCAYNQITSLLALPTSLQYLYCYNNQLTSLPALPTGLTNFQCDNNQLTILPALPTGVTIIGCSGNLLTSLPTLPTGLRFLNCGSNQLTILPALPTGVATLNCNNNQLTSLPALPTGMQYLYCFNNQITSLPALPSGLIELHFDNTKISCIIYSGTGLLLYDVDGVLIGYGQNYPKCVVLPVEMTEFKAKSGNNYTVHLFWQTASERNNNRFDIERSTDGQLYTLIGQVKGNGTTQITNEYQFTDDKIPVASIYYYRLNQIDNDGTSKFSPVVSVEIADTKLRVYPTVVYDRIRILSANNTLPVTVTDIAGRIIREYATTPESIDVSNLGVGMYIVRIGNEAVRVIKTDR